MKKLLLITMVSCFWTALPASAATNEGYDKTGTVIKYDMGTCMEGNIHYGLKPVGQKQADWLSASKSDEAILEAAMKGHGWVEVKGDWHQGTECRYVKVTNVHPVKKKS
jgi:hypothetical protein